VVTFSRKLPDSKMSEVVSEFRIIHNNNNNNNNNLRATTRKILILMSKCLVLHSVHRRAPLLLAILLPLVFSPTIVDQTHHLQARTAATTVWGVGEQAETFLTYRRERERGHCGAFEVVKKCKAETRPLLLKIPQVWLGLQVAR
jgi:hypothetical protein